MANDAVTEGLTKLLANTYALYAKTQGFHWNVSGPMFKALHDMFGGQYDELSDAIDTIAERIRALEGTPPGSLQGMLDDSDIKEEAGAPNAQAMLRQLVDDNGVLGAMAREVAKAAEAANDQATIELLGGRANAHEKARWMLRSQLGEGAASTPMIVKNWAKKKAAP